jgi:hypothetical protein
MTREPTAAKVTLFAGSAAIFGTSRETSLR